MSTIKVLTREEWEEYIRKEDAREKSPGSDIHVRIARDVLAMLGEVSVFEQRPLRRIFYDAIFDYIERSPIPVPFIRSVMKAQPGPGNEPLSYTPMPDGLTLPRFASAST